RPFVFQPCTIKVCNMVITLLISAEMSCFRSSNTLTQSSAVRYQVSRSLTLRLGADLDRNRATRCQPCSSGSGIYRE
ncbi:hypothetical protein P692DRAFT_20840184, partial [Suillus brevipes Sb2]